ncbi:MAG TPA: sugar phosphate isomerase/epimerase family protein [Flavisolibacter sp.]|jgi:sugar phosphate isomerase/epimerase|nr:sugar phosphate isomerase/epimerase family protein [Flavisolibacter sp.]
MKEYSRKEFIQNSGLALASLAIGPLLHSGQKKPLLSFSTLGCPDWTFPQITDFARQHGYSGIEVRGLQRQMDLPQCPEFSTPENRRATMAIMKKKGLQFVGLGSSDNLHSEGEERAKNLSDAKRFIDLAQQINCPYVRVFPNNFPKEREKAATIQLIIDGLKTLGDYAKDKNVMVLLETHGDVVWTADLLAIMQGAAHPAVGLIWDISNMWTVTKEDPAEAYRQLKPYIRHTHIKDAKLVEGKLQYTLLGQGDVPIFSAISELAKSGYKGYYSFEWEKLWHPEIAEPEVALAHYPTAMKAHFRKF